MGVVVTGGGDLTRAYFGTDTHAFGILVGVALAFMLAPLLDHHQDSGRTAPAHPPRAVAARHRAALLTGTAGVLALLGIVAIALQPATDGAATFPGALIGAGLLSAIAIVAGVWPGSLFGRALDVRPLRWIGDRSYGLYLWHWPLLVLAVAAVQGTGTTAGFPVWIGVAVLLATVIVAEMSYRFVETPVRRLGFRGALSRLSARLGSGSHGRLRRLGMITATLVVLGGTTAAISAAPAATRSEALVAAGQAALDEALRTPTPTAGSTGEPTPTASPAPSTPASRPDPGPVSREDGEISAAGLPSPPPAVSVPGDQVTAVGDSVMLASVPALFERLPGIQVDAAVSRSSWAGPGILEDLAARGELRPYVVIALGTNGAVHLPSLERMAEIAGPDRRLVLVNAHAPRDWIAGVNADLDAFAASRPRVVVADWSGAIADQPALLAGDGIHPDTDGGAVFAQTVAAALDGVAQARAQKQYEIQLRMHGDIPPERSETRAP